jgi:hypothetical protein
MDQCTVSNETEAATSVSVNVALHFRFAGFTVGGAEFDSNFVKYQRTQWVAALKF